MQRISAKELADWWIRLSKSSAYNRLLAGRFFRATIASVTGSGPYLVSLVRNNESAGDGGSYLCAAPGYVPAISDDVQMVWIDDKQAIVVGPVSRPTIQTGTLVLTVGSGTTGTTGPLVFPAAYPTSVTPLLFGSVQNTNNTAAGERPLSATPYQVTNVGCNFAVYLSAAAGANRILTIGWLAIG